MGDGIVDRQKVDGTIRCARVEYSPQTSRFLTETLGVRQVPSLHLYVGTAKVWSNHGKTNCNELRTEIVKLESMSAAELLAHTEAVDDGILQEAIEDSFYDSPSFLDEEW
jgi:hypothetical protein